MFGLGTKHRRTTLKNTFQRWEGGAPKGTSVLNQDGKNFVDKRPGGMRIVSTPEGNLRVVLQMNTQAREYTVKVKADGKVWMSAGGAFQSRKKKPAEELKLKAGEGVGVLVIHGDPEEPADFILSKLVVS